MLYIRLLKKSVLSEIDIDNATIDFMKKIEKTAIAFVRFTLVDAGMAKYKPSIMAASFVFLGFQI